MKTVLVICGTGIATSTMVAMKLKSYFDQPGKLKVQVRQGKVMDLLLNPNADVIVATTQVPSSVKTPVVNSVGLLTGCTLRYGLASQPVRRRVAACRW